MSEKKAVMIENKMAMPVYFGMDYINEMAKIPFNIRHLMACYEAGNVAKNLDVPTKIGKDGKVLKSYSAVSYTDVINTCKPFMAKYLIGVDEEFNDFIKEEVKTVTGQFGERSEIFLRQKVVMRFTDAISYDKEDPNTYISATGYGDGIDSGDKAPGKSSTYAHKYCYINGFMLGMGEDPDQEASPEYQMEIENGPKKKAEEPKKKNEDPKDPKKKEMAISSELVNAINFERGQLGRYGVDVRSDAFIKFLKQKTGLETTDPAKHTNATGTKLLSFLKSVRKAKADQADVTDKVIEEEPIDNDDLPF